MAMVPKLESQVGQDWHPHQYRDQFCVEKTTGPSRICFSSSKGYIDRLAAFSTVMSGPFFVLYVLLVSRRGNESARYQSPELSREELQRFLDRFENYLEQDGRHHAWIHSTQDAATLVYDNHNVVYAYGPLPAFCDVLTRQGFQEIDSIRYPVPHGHRYNGEFDDEEDAMMKYFPWTKSPLRDGDNP